MKFKYIAATALTLITLFVVSSACFAAETSDSTINGVIWMDTNNNGIFEPTEETVSDAIVNIRHEDEDLIQSLLVGEDGYFEISNLPYGLYDVWAEVDGKASETVLVEINEVSPVTVIDIAFVPETPSLQYQIWMPLLVRQ